MAVVYFTSNASTGAGSLAEAVANASSGDIIRPDESVFERGSIIEIALAETLTLDKNLTLDASPFRVRLDRGGSGTAVSLNGGFEGAFVGYDFTGAATTGNGGGLYAPSDATVTLRRCGFYGCSAAYGGGLCATGVSRVYDCVFVGCRATQYGGGINVARDAVLNGVTVAGCVAATGGGAMRVASGACVVENSILAGSIAGAYNSTATGSVVDVASSQIGFAAPPPDDLTSDTWDANAWQNWDLRLLDDASASPSPYRDSGDVDLMSQYDYQGNFRGRETNGAASCSPGAYETIQADLFWVGRDATGAEVVAPSWNASSGWAASRFATTSGDKAPQSGDAVFVDGAPTFDVSSFRVSRLVVGGGTSLGVKNTGASTLTLVADNFDFGYGSTVRNAAGTSRLQISGSAASRFGDYVYFPQQFYFNNADTLQIASTAKFTTVVSTVKLYANGTYNNYNLQISEIATIENGSTGCNNIYVKFQKPTARIAATGSPRVVSNMVKWTTPTGATDDFAGLTEGSTPIVFAPKKSATVAGAGSANDFDVDISEAPYGGSLALTLTGQTVYGVNTATANLRVKLLASGRLGVGAQVLQVGELVVNDLATLTGGSESVAPIFAFVTLAEGASLTITGLTLDASLTIPSNATLAVDGGTVSASSLTLENGARVVVVGVEKDAVFSASGSNVHAQGATINGDGLAAGNVSVSSDGTLIVDAGTIDLTLGSVPGTLSVFTGGALIVNNGTIKTGGLTVTSATVDFIDESNIFLQSANVTTSRATGSGVFFAPMTAPEGLALENGAIWGDTSAGVTSLKVVPTDATKATFSVVKTVGDANIFAQYSEDDGATWQTINTTADVDEYVLTVTQGSEVLVRVATSNGWLIDSASTAVFAPVWTVTDAFETVVGIVQAYEIATGGSNDGLNVYDANDYGY